MKWDEPDGINSWIIAFSCCFINAVLNAMPRISGMLFVASVSRFNVERKKASFPYALSSAMRNLTGPVGGYLGYKFGVRTITASGALIGAVGVGVCFLAENITLVTIFYGIVFGLGFCLGYVLLPVIINQYFDKHRATASGISHSGACLGTFILPPIVEILLNNYGLSQTFLFLSGFIFNCVPVALLLRKPIFEIQRKTSYNREQAEKQCDISRRKKPFYTIGNDCNTLGNFQNTNSNIRGITTDRKSTCENDTDATYKKNFKRLSNETLLPVSSVHRTEPEYIDTREVIKSSKVSKQGIFKSQLGGTFTLTPDNVNDRRNTTEGTVSGRNIFSPFVDCKEKVSSNNHSQCSSNNLTFYRREIDTLDMFKSESYQKHCFQTDVPALSVNTDVTAGADSRVLQHAEKQPSRSTCHFKDYSNELVITPDNLKTSTHHSLQNSKLLQRPDVNSKKQLHKKSTYLESESKQGAPLSSFNFIFDPFFVLIAITHATLTFSMICMLTIIVDFSRDLNIDESKEKYILMLLSLGDYTGRLGLGWITDRGYMRTSTFTAVCFACKGLLTLAVAWSNDFVSLATIVPLLGLSQSGLIVIYPILIAQFIEHDKQTVAIPSSHFLSGLVCLAISPVIGYFRDEVGAYDWIFYIMTMLSAASSVSWIFFPWLIKSRRKS